MEGSHHPKRRKGRETSKDEEGSWVHLLRSIHHASSRFRRASFELVAGGPLSATLRFEGVLGGSLLVPGILCGLGSLQCPHGAAFEHRGGIACICRIRGQTTTCCGISFAARATQSCSCLL